MLQRITREGEKGCSPEIDYSGFQIKENYACYNINTRCTNSLYNVCQHACTLNSRENVHYVNREFLGGFSFFFSFLLTSLYYFSLQLHDRATKSG